MDADVLAQFRQHAAEAAKHERCGPKSACRRDALKLVDQDLDAILALPILRDASPSPIAG